MNALIEDLFVEDWLKDSSSSSEEKYDINLDSCTFFYKPNKKLYQRNLLGYD